MIEPFCLVKEILYDRTFVWSRKYFMIEPLSGQGNAYFSSSKLSAIHFERGNEVKGCSKQSKPI